MHICSTDEGRLSILSAPANVVKQCEQSHHTESSGLRLICCLPTELHRQVASGLGTVFTCRWPGKNGGS